MNIDERLERLTERHEALTQTLELMARDAEAEREKMKRLDVREKRAREALMAGITAYMQVLAEGDED